MNGAIDENTVNFEEKQYIIDRGKIQKMTVMLCRCYMSTFILLVYKYCKQLRYFLCFTWCFHVGMHKTHTHTHTHTPHMHTYIHTHTCTRVYTA